MNKTELESLSDIRLNEAKCLLANGFYHGAYYLCGYAVECALKACISKSFLLHEFPDKKIVNESYTHNLETLLKLANLQQKLQQQATTSPDLEINWAVIKGWSEQFRYEHSISKVMAEELISAAEDTNFGVLQWVRLNW